MNHEQMSLIARREGEDAMRAAEARADRDSPGLPDVMYAYLVKFAINCERGHRFQSEEVTIGYAADDGFEQPHEMRSWGGIFTRAINRGVIAYVDSRGVRALGHGTTGAKRYRSLVIGRAPGSIDMTPPKRSSKARG